MFMYCDNDYIHFNTCVQVVQNLNPKIEILDITQRTCTSCVCMYLAHGK